MKIKVCALVERLIEAYKNDCEMELYWDVDVKKVVTFLDGDLDFTKHPNCVLLGGYTKSQLEKAKVSEFLTPEEIPLYCKHLKTKDIIVDNMCDLTIENVENIEEFLAEYADFVKEEGEEDFYERLRDFFERYCLNKEIIEDFSLFITDAELENIAKKGCKNGQNRTIGNLGKR